MLGFIPRKAAAPSGPLTLPFVLDNTLRICREINSSRLSVSSKLNLKGKAGNLIGRVFYYFEAITEDQGSFSFRNFYKSGAKKRLILYLDNLLISVENKDKYIEKLTVDKDRPLFTPAVLLTVVFILVSYIMLKTSLRYPSILLLCIEVTY